MKNQEIAAQFDEIADALEIKGDLRFKVLAYRRAARALQELTEDVAVLAADDRLRAIPGIGEGTAKKIVEFLKTGKMCKHEEALAGLSGELLNLLKIQGLGPKTLALAHTRLHVNNLADLKLVLDNGSLASLPGMGEQKVDNLRRGIALREQVGSRMSLALATEVADKVIAHLKRLPQVREATPAGSLRRCRETIGDIDILATGREPEKIVEHFIKTPGSARVLGAGDTKASIVIGSGADQVQVDLRVLPDDTYGAALQYFTGSKDHNVKLRTLARQKGLKISEYGVFRGSKRIAGRTESDVYATMNMPVMPPEIREDRGEIEAALAGKLPKLVELGDIKGDLHVHTDRSDGTSTMEQMAEAARNKGYAYMSVTDHSPTAAYAGGLSIDKLKESMGRVEQLNRQFKGFRLLKSTEVDILPNGKVDYPDRVLEQLDIVVASIHQSFKKNITERICAALENPHVDIIAHPSGRLLSRREGYDVNLDKVLECAKLQGKAVELNSYPDRLDLNDLYLRKAKELGIKIAISTDAHGIKDLDWMRFGIATARRGWLEKVDVINCLPLQKLLAWLKHSRRS